MRAGSATEAGRQAWCGCAAVADLSVRLLPQVMVQGILVQLWGPLQSLGGLYRRLRKAFVDMEDLIELLNTRPTMADGHLTLPTA
jgi:ABC-type transport system involved in Fe-S cluster assembly fused permease/ATPase subunit